MPVTSAHGGRRPIVRLLAPFARFLHHESSSSIVLLAATILALAFANSAYAGTYEGLLELPMGVALAAHPYHWTVRECINDGLMAVFFLSVGLEVKREILIGELASFSRAVLPVFGALGGVITPALIYFALNHGGIAERGWGVPIATDIAFSVAILNAFGKRIPLGLKVFLVALAIADDIGGVLVIAFVYATQIHPLYLVLAAVCFLACIVLNRMGVVHLFPYVATGFAMWLCVHASGIHATLAGILLAIAMPSKAALPAEEFIGHGKKRLTQFEELCGQVEHPGHGARKPLRDLRTNLMCVQPSADRLQEAIEPWVAYVIVPLFALANADIPIAGLNGEAIRNPAFLGILFGLLIGKPIGITAFSWLAVRARIAHLPPNVRWIDLHAASWLGGIGFTVSIFIAGLAFGNAQDYTLARIAVLIASICAAAVGSAIVVFVRRSAREAV